MIHFSFRLGANIYWLRDLLALWAVLFVFAELCAFTYGIHLLWAIGAATAIFGGLLIGHLTGLVEGIARE